MLIQHRWPPATTRSASRKTAAGSPVSRPACRRRVPYHGAIRSQVDDDPVTVYHAGESWSEQPHADHRVSENASETKPAKLLAIFITSTKSKGVW